MQKLLYLIAAFSLASCLSNMRDSDDISPTDKALILEFYKPYIQATFGGDSTAIQQFIKRESETLDSCYLIHYDQPINGYDIRMVVRCNSRNTQDIECSAVLFIAQGEKVICDTTRIYLPDSVYESLSTHIVNKMGYEATCCKDFDTQYPCLSQFSAMPFVFFDVDFDGEKELLMRINGIGQRSHNCYYPKSLIWDNPCHLEDDKFVHCGDIQKANYLFFPLDDMTQFNSADKTIIFYISAGWWDNEWHYYKVENGESRLIKKIVEYDRNDPKVKRITYNNNDSTITHIPVNKADNSYSID